MNSMIPELVQALEGIWTAPYGGHGLETISVQCAATPIISRNENAPCPVGFPRLEGMKILGDAHIPTSKLSFVVDLSTPYDPLVRLGADRRLVVGFPLDGYFVTDLALREPNIIGWYRGVGQVNHNKGTWQPQWVGLDFVVYDSKSSPAVVFSLVWDDKEDEMRHIFDFQRISFT